MKRYRLPLALAALLAAVLLAPPARAEERANVPEKLKWNTADLYAIRGRLVPGQGRHRRRASRRWRTSRASSATRPTASSRALSTIEDLDKDLTQLQVYASMRGDEDTRLAKPREMNQAIEQLAVQFYSTISYVRPEILALGAEQGERLRRGRAKRLEPYKPFLDDILRYEPHTLSAPEEKVAAEAAHHGGQRRPAPTAPSPTPTCPTPRSRSRSGEKVRLDAAGLHEVPRRHEPRGPRQGLQGLLVALQGLRAHAAAPRSTRTSRPTSSTRTCTSSTRCLEAALFDSNIPASVYTAAHRRRARQPADAAPLPQAAPAHDGRGPAALRGPLRADRQEGGPALHARAGQGPGAQGRGARWARDYVATLKKGYESRWVDFMPTTGKRSGAYSTGAYGVHPVPAAELHRPLRGGLDPGPRVGPLDAHLPLRPEPALRHPRLPDLRGRGGLDAQREPAPALHAGPDQGRTRACSCWAATSTACARRSSARRCSPSSS